MATATSHISHSSTNNRIRVINPRRDLIKIADLIELCFSETLDPDGQRYIRRMRKAGDQNRGRWLDAPSLMINMAAEGFVWEEDGAIVGNISLIPFARLGLPVYLIANVAVHPDHRRRGIARALTTTTINHIKSQRIQAVWLQVRENNQPAVSLYESIGFVEKARRTTWTLKPGKLSDLDPTGWRIVKHGSRHWKHQRKWIHQNYPDELFWYWPVNPSVFRPGIAGMLSRLFYETQVRQWGVEDGGRLRGILSWKTTKSYADQLWLAAPLESEARVLQTVLPHIQWHERAHRALSIDYPVDRAATTFNKAGFHPDYTLIWMQL
jgi:GNAT superfamily N-acetyltransferase